MVVVRFSVFEDKVEERRLRVKVKPIVESVGGVSPPSLNREAEREQKERRDE